MLDSLCADQHVVLGHLHHAVHNHLAIHHVLCVAAEGAGRGLRPAHRAQHGGCIFEALLHVDECEVDGRVLVEECGRVGPAQRRRRENAAQREASFPSGRAYPAAPPPTTTTLALPRSSRFRGAPSVARRLCSVASAGPSPVATSRCAGATASPNAAAPSPSGDSWVAVSHAARREALAEGAISTASGAPSAKSASPAHNIPCQLRDGRFDRCGWAAHSPR